MDAPEFARSLKAQWQPRPGRHVVQLLDAGDKAVDEVKLEMRGAGVRQPNSAARRVEKNFAFRKFIHVPRPTAPLR